MHDVVTFLGVRLDLLDQSSTPDRTESNTNTVQPLRSGSFRWNPAGLNPLMSERKRKSKEGEVRCAKCRAEDTETQTANSRGRFPAASGPFSTRAVWELTLMIRHEKRERALGSQTLLPRTSRNPATFQSLFKHRAFRARWQEKDLRAALFPFFFFRPFPLILVFTTQENKSNLYKWANAYWMRLRRRSMDLPLTPTAHCLYLFPLRN